MAPSIVSMRPIGLADRGGREIALVVFCEGQVSRLESLLQSREIAADRVAARSGLRPALRLIRQHLLQCRVSLLSARQVSGLERTGQLFKILHDLLAAALLMRLRRAGYERNGRS